MRAVIVGEVSRLEKIYPARQRARLAEFFTLSTAIIPAADLSAHVATLKNAEVIFTADGFPRLSATQIAAGCPALQAVFYAGAQVMPDFAPPLLARGIKVISAWKATLLPTAQIVVAQILQSGKNLVRAARELRNFAAWEKARAVAIKTPDSAFTETAFTETVALLGANALSKTIAALLKPFGWRILLCDAALSLEAAEALGVEKVELAAAFARAGVVSNHWEMPPEILPPDLFASLPRNATFISIAPTFVGSRLEKSLIATLPQRPDLTALIDVAVSSPTSPLYQFANVLLTPDWATLAGKDLLRFSEQVIADVEKWLNHC